MVTDFIALLIICCSWVWAVSPSTQSQTSPSSNNLEHFRLHIPINDIVESIHILDVVVCRGERLEDAVSSAFISTRPVRPQDILHSAILKACNLYPNSCDGQPPSSIISFNLFDNDSFIIREGYSVDHLLQCYCSLYSCVDDRDPPTPSVDKFHEIYSGLIPEDKLQQYFSPPEPPSVTHMTKRRHDDRILVSIASYRDPQLLATITSLITLSADPSKLTIVICEQASPSDPGINWQHDVPTRGATLILISLDSSQARGPTWARYLIQQQWTGEQFYLQIDSHMRFVVDWDLKLKRDLGALPPYIANKACLTNYPPRFDVQTEEVDGLIRGPMYATHIDPHDRFIRFDSDYIYERVPLDTDSDGGSAARIDPSLPVLSKGWSGCFSFSSSQVSISFRTLLTARRIFSAPVSSHFSSFLSLIASVPFALRLVLILQLPGLQTLLPWLLMCPV